MRSTLIALGLVGACALCCAPLMIAVVTGGAAGLAAWTGLTLVQTVGVALVALALAVAGVVALKRPMAASCDCEVQCEVETCEKP